LRIWPSLRAKSLLTYNSSKVPPNGGWADMEQFDQGMGMPNPGRRLPASPCGEGKVW
jgi:hypothetical protein